MNLMIRSIPFALGQRADGRLVFTMFPACRDKISRSHVPLRYKQRWFSLTRRP